MEPIREPVLSGSTRPPIPVPARSGLSLARDRAVADEAPDPPSDSDVEDELVAPLARAALALDRACVGTLVRKALAPDWWRGCTNVLAPAARRTGREWSRDRCSFVDVTLAVSLLQRSVRGGRLDEGAVCGGRGRILISSAPDSQHTFGLILVAERLRRAGWYVDLGWPFTRPSPPSRRLYDGYGVSVSGPRDFEWAASWSEQVDRSAPDAPFLVGGAGAESFGADAGVRSRGGDLQSLLG